MKHLSRLEKIAPYLFLVAIVLVFFIGFSWQKIATLTKSPQKTPLAEVTTGAPKLSDDDLKGYAKQIGLDTDKFNSCLDSNKYQTKVDNDVIYASELGVAGTPGFYVNGHYIDGLISYPNLKQVLDFELSGGDWNKAPEGVLNDATSYSLDIDIVNSQTKGNKDAKVVLIEFADFECPYCNDFFNDTESQLIKDYVDTGKVFFVFKNYPIILAHPRSYKAAEAGECAAEQGKFWEMHNAIFSSSRS